MQGDESCRGDQFGNLEAVGQLLPLPGHPQTSFFHQDARQCSVTLPGLLAESHHPGGFAPVPGISRILTFPFENL